jgi:hypothetical protein
MGISFSQWKMKQEVTLRGMYLMQACDLEVALLHIMLYCIVKVVDPEPISRKFSEMMMSKKINTTIEDLKTYRPDYYTEYQDFFDRLIKFKKIRNQFAHCIMIWDKNHPDSFEFMEIVVNGKEEKLVTERVMIEEAKNNLFDFKDIILGIAKLADVLQREFKQKYPV